MSKKRPLGGTAPAESYSPVPVSHHMSPSDLREPHSQGLPISRYVLVGSICDSQHLLITLLAASTFKLLNAVMSLRSRSVLASIRVFLRRFGPFDSLACISLTIVPMCLCPKGHGIHTKRGAMFESSSIAGE